MMPYFLSLVTEARCSWDPLWMSIFQMERLPELLNFPTSSKAGVSVTVSQAHTSSSRFFSTTSLICHHKEISYIIKRAVICINIMLCSHPEGHIRVLEAFLKLPVHPHFSPLNHPICHLVPQKEVASQMATWKIKKSITQNVS